MNIFVLDYCPVKSARMLCDKHVVKMPLETAQMLCTILHENGIDAPYRPTHRNHPCTIWAGRSFMNFQWLVKHGIELCREYEFRYGKSHKCLEVIQYCHDNMPTFADYGSTSFALAMPNEYKTYGAVASYQNYYLNAKAHLLKYTRRETPYFL